MSVHIGGLNILCAIILQIVTRLGPIGSFEQILLVGGTNPLITGSIPNLKRGGAQPGLW